MTIRKGSSYRDRPPHEKTELTKQFERELDATERIFPTDQHGNPLGPARDEIVRCRDCRYYQLDPEPIDPGWPMMCERTGDDMVEPYGFCAWGARAEA